ncbi:GNAT family N-acetyltransferase [Micromonospora sp. WMMD1102]|uniref:GNAT family N-acetyltransferase n=1 Tax=Micromonospora sp. WMMD1102 TaxID=3016105 RepID=UPI00241579DB|nr:GNAT family N-acetyltransferase [Micromonospora sp. WMMD1102]MDG4786637.1 GNAT family N-acetyltransferase [Micromonospora sp. WMMD1102]
MTHERSGVPVLRRLTGTDALALRDRLVETYAAVFCAPPWNDPPERAARFGELLSGWARMPGFVAVLAEADGTAEVGGASEVGGMAAVGGMAEAGGATGSGGYGGAVRGFALGLTTPAPFPTDRAYGQVRRLLGPAAETLPGWLEVAELAVRPAARRSGLGRRLLAALTGERPAWLLTVPQVAGTTDFYDAVGWIRHGTGYGITLYTNQPLPR